MKTKILTLILTLFATLTFASTNGSVQLGWLPSCDTSVVGTRVYYGLVTNSRLLPMIGSLYFPCYTNTETIYHYDAAFSNTLYSSGNATSIVVSNLTCGATYVFAVTAVDDTGVESDFSSEVLYYIPLDLNTNVGNWGDKTNWPVYQSGRAAPTLTLAPYSYNITWLVPPQVVTNYDVDLVTNNTVITEVTNSRISTNFFESKIRNYLLQSDMVIKTNWTVQTSQNLLNWTNSFSGSNSPVNNLILNEGGNKFFRLKF